MPFDLPLPAPFASRGWRAKIRDRERLEVPHITVLFKTRSWRIGLRDLAFLDRAPPPREVPRVVLNAVAAEIEAARDAWNAMYPSNPV